MPPRHPLRVAYLDLDGTLTRDGSVFHGEGGVTLDGALALARLHDAGVEIVPCSGRTVAQLSEVARLLGSRTFIAELGSVVAYDGGRRTVPSLPGAPDADALSRTGVAEAVMREFGLEWHDPWHLRRSFTLLMRGKADAAEVRAFLHERYPQLSLTFLDNGRIMEDGTHAYHLLPAGVDKGAAIARDREERGLPREACVSFGDSESDLAMAPHVVRHYWIGGPETLPSGATRNVTRSRSRFGEGLLESVSDALEPVRIPVTR